MPCSARGLCPFHHHRPVTRSVATLRKLTGFGRFPSRHFAINAVWPELSVGAIDLLAWMRVLLLDGELAAVEPKRLRYRLLHVAARLTRGGRRLRLRISQTWPWRHELAAAYNRLATLPVPPAGQKTPDRPRPERPRRTRPPRRDFAMLKQRSHLTYLATDALRRLITQPKRRG